MNNAPSALSLFAQVSTGGTYNPDTGGSHACGVQNGERGNPSYSSGTLVCWGDNTFGQATPPAGPFAQVSAGGAHSCAVRTDGTLTCWGDNTYGQTTPLALTTLTPSVSFPFAADGGTAITWTATASGFGPLQYRFVRWQQSTNTTTIVQPLGGSPTCSWTPTAGEAGTYQLGVYARDANGHWLSLFTPVFVITGPALSITSLTADQAFPFTADGATGITWTATAAGGAAPLQYRFVRWQQSTNTTTIVQALGPSTTYSWTPTAADAGAYQIGVYVRDASNHWASLFTGVFQIIGTPLTISSLTANQAFPFTADGGTAIAWTAAAAGGASSLQYRFVRYRQSTGTVTTVQALSTNNTYAWTPSPADAGLYQIGVYVRDATGHWASLFTALVQIIGQPLSITSLTANQAFPFTADGVASITWTASATGGVAPLSNRFVRFNQATGITTIVQALGASNAYSWTPGPGDAGLYQIGVYVRDNVGVWRSSFTSIFQIQ